ncbi:TadE/TadG family type IV pilus assembly protein [Alteraurantiacibacter aquimixticola]|uniref:Pilus assembly protein n=1 Tax=Alteraurantiacibacter aquimixticola TaxID=2489173 RepID=A0A4T3F5L6_9SPHN|nr:pilus assembly protein [Alteraurantiacibacter aquimixticola]TIX50126.1 pilus assembly protein [Alteraurantiacibacter aquimixticola]
MRDRTALAATEFALTFPVLLSMGLMGLELANRAIVQMRIHQLAVHVADNASRIGDQSMLENRRIYESDFEDLFHGAELQIGHHLDLFGRGRVVVSSLEVLPGTEGDQYIHWQRCMGTKQYTPRFGEEGDGRETEFPGMGPAGEEVIAFANEAVMFVEIAYDYDPLIGNPFGMPTTIAGYSSFTVRDDRDLSQIYQRDPGHPDSAADCDTYSTLDGAGTTPGG